MSYNESNVIVQDVMEGIRKSPGMYISGTGENGKQHMIREVIHNSIDEITMGRATQIKVTLHDDNKTVTIEDDGPGIPTGIHPKSGISTVETVVTRLHSGGKFDSKAYSKAGGMHGVGLTVVNALSDHMRIEVKRDGQIWAVDFSKGITKEPLKAIGKTAEHGTKITFTPDYTIMDEGEYDPEVLYKELDDLAYLNKGAKFIFVHQGEEKDISHNDGVAGMINKYTVGEKVLTNPIVISGVDEQRGIDVDIAFNYTHSAESTIIAFTNNIENPDGGRHVDGFKSALTKAINNISNKDYKGEEVRLGLIAVVAIRMTERPVLEGQTKSKLGSKEAQPAVDSIAYQAIMTQFSGNSKLVKFITQRADRNRNHKNALAEIKDLQKEQTAKFSNLISNHIAATKRGQKGKELYISEGKSAGGNAKAKRIPATQGILPIRGVTKNTFDETLKKVLAVYEIRAILTALGIGVLEDADPEKCNYEKIIIHADADPDGAHIQLLLITFFVMWMRPLVEAGMLYVALPPLYKVEDARNPKTYIYCHDEEERDAAVTKIGSNARIQRYKGLGEMDADELFETTMDPETRTIIQITIEDAEEAEAALAALVGSDTAIRKEILMEESVWDATN